MLGEVFCIFKFFLYVGASMVAFVNISLAHFRVYSSFVQVSIFLLRVCPTYICRSSSSSSSLVFGCHRRRRLILEQDHPYE